MRREIILLYLSEKGKVGLIRQAEGKWRLPVVLVEDDNSIFESIIGFTLANFGATANGFICRDNSNGHEVWECGRFDKTNSGYQKKNTKWERLDKL